MCDVQLLVMYGPGGDSKTVEMFNTKVGDMTVQQLQEAAVKKFPGQGDVRPTYNGRTLDDANTLLSKYGICNKSVIHLVLKVHGG